MSIERRSRIKIRPINVGEVEISHPQLFGGESSQAKDVFEVKKPSDIAFLLLMTGIGYALTLLITSIRTGQAVETSAEPFLRRAIERNSDDDQPNTPEWHTKVIGDFLLDVSKQKEEVEV